jgi:hypothetical protein
MGKTPGMFISKVALRVSLLVVAVSFAYLSAVDLANSNIVYAFRIGLLMSVVFASYRKLAQKTNGRPLSTIEANAKPIFAYSLTTLSLVLILFFALPNLQQTANPEYDALRGPVFVEECVYDYAQGEICGEKDLNPEFIQRGENIRLFVFALICGVYYFFYKRISRWLESLKVTEVNGRELGFEAKLDGIDLSNHNLTKAYLVGADLSKANLSHTKLLCASLFRANMEGANLKGANLRGADLSRANLKGADLSGASLLETVLTDAIMPDGTIHD